jgi:general secretion pathway protein M
MSKPSALAPLRARLAPLLARCATLPLRERRLLTIAGAALLALILWLVAIQPAWRTLKAAPAQIDALELQWQTMQRLAAEARELRGTAPMSLEQSSAALKAATTRLADNGRLSVQGERAVLTLNNASTAQLREWLAEARSGARARPVEASLSRAAQGYSGTLVVSLGGAP